jgi:hypothetical protein
MTSWSVKATETDSDLQGQTQRDQYDVFNLRAKLFNYNEKQGAKVSLADVKAALQKLKKDGFKGLPDPDALTAENAQKMDVLAGDICGVVRIIGPNGQVTGFGPLYYGAAGKAAALGRANAECVSGFHAVAIDGALR